MTIDNDNYIFIGLLITWGVLLSRIILGWVKPNNDQDKRISALEINVSDFSKHLEETKKAIKDNALDLNLLKENDIKHIEVEMGKINIQLTEFMTILKERLPNSHNGFKK